jgi:hypothetical protein
MHHDGDAKRAKPIEDRGEALIIDADQLSGGIAHAEAKVLPELESDNAVGDEAVDTLQGEFDKAGEVGRVRTVPIHPANG